MPRKGLHTSRRSGGKSDAAPQIVRRTAPDQGVGLAAFEFIDRLASLDEPAEIQDAFVKAIAPLGITNFAVMQVTSDPDAFPRAVIDDAMPEGWKQRYFEQRYAEVDPCVAEAMTSLDPFLWSEALARSRRDKTQRRVFHEAGEFRLNEGLIIPIYGPDGYVAFATLAGDRLDLAPASRAALHVMALYTHNRLMNLLHTAGRPRPNLTRREVECLKWASAGKSDWEIGEILTISERTAHWYIECAKRKLGVATRIQAVMSAVAARFIAP